MKEILEVIGKLGIGGGIGALVGLGLARWVEPTTKGGLALLVLISVIFFMTMASIVSKIFGWNKPSGNNAGGAGNDKAA